MQLKETGAGEVTVWLAEMAVTMGATDAKTEDIDYKVTYVRIIMINIVYRRLHEAVVL